MNQTRKMKCQKEDQAYNPLSSSFIDKINMAFLNLEQNEVIFCQLNSIRIYSTTQQKYTKAHYDIKFNPEFLFYNQKLGYIIFQVKELYIFKEVNLKTFEYKNIELPTQNQSATSYTRIQTKEFQLKSQINQITFLDDGTYLYGCSDLGFISILDQKTHSVIYKISLANKMDYCAEWFIDKTDGYLFYINQSKVVELINYQTNTLMGSLLQTSSGAVIAYFSYDQIKKKLFVIQTTILYIVDLKNKYLSFQTYTKEYVTNFSISFKRNKIYLASIYNNVIIDMVQVMNNNTIHYLPQYFRINDQKILHINDNLFIISLFQETSLLSQIQLRQLKYGGFTISHKPSFNQILVFINNQINVISYSNNILKLINVINLEAKYLKIVKDTSDFIIIQLQSQNLIKINKSSNEIIIEPYFQLTTGLCYFITTRKYIAFTDCIVNDKLLILDSNSKQLSTRTLTNQFVSMKILGHENPQIVILTTTSLILFDLEQQQQIKEVLCNIPLDSVIEIDYLYNRIMLVNQFYDTLLFNFQLDKYSSKNIVESFGLNPQMDENFVYFISTYSANIYFRKDFEFLFNFRQFETHLTLQKISYLKVGYFFLVEFIEKISVYELSPFLQIPVEKLTIPLQNYNLINFSFSKTTQDLKNTIYSLQIYGINFESSFNYSFNLDLQDSKTSAQCSQNYELLNDDTFEQSQILLLNQQLLTLKQKLTSLTVKINNKQTIKLPNILSSYLDDNFNLEYISTNQFQKVIVNNQFYIDTSINFLKIKNIQLEIDESNPVFIEINPTKFQGLKKLHLENVILKDIKLIISNLDSIIIKKLKIQSTSKMFETSLLITNVKLITIDEIEISGQTIYLKDELIGINQSDQAHITSITLKSVKLSPYDTVKQRILTSNLLLKKVIYVNQLNNLKIEKIETDDIFLENTQIIDIQNVQQINIEQIKITNSKWNLNFDNQLNYALNSFYTINTLTIGELFLENINSNSINSMNINKFSQLQSLSISKLNYANLIHRNKDENSQNNFSIHLESVKDTVISNVSYFNSENVGLLNAVSLKVTPILLAFNQMINLSNITINKLSKLSQLININSIQANLSNLILYGISISNKYIQAIIQIQTEQNIEINNFEAKQINNNLSSVILIYKSETINMKNLLFQNIITQGSSSCFMVVDSLNLIIEESLFENNSSEEDSGSIYFEQVKNISLINNKFQKNKSNKGSGGAIYCLESNFQQIIQNLFMENYSINGSGGAIYLESCDIKKLNKNQFINNSAFIGGAIRYQLLKPEVFFKKNSLIDIKFSNIFSKNTCISYGKDIGSYPVILDVKYSYDDDLQIGIAKIENVPSGYKPEEPLKVRFIDEEYSEVAFFSPIQYPDINENIANEFSQYYLSIESQQIGLLGDLNQGYKLDQYAFTFDLSYSFQPEKSQTITVKSNRALPQFVENQQQIKYLLYIIEVEISFRRCQAGEILLQQGKYTICYQCTQGFYNLIDPYLDESQSCLRCPQGSFNCTLNQISVKNGYWRENEQSDKIVECEKRPENCQPENIDNTINYCIQGHVGPLCEECDSRGEVWNSTYGKNTDFTCVDCERFSNSENMSILVLVFLFLLAYIYFQIYKQISVSQKQIASHYLIKMGFTLQRVQGNSFSLSSNMKILISYFQYLAIINSLNIKIRVDFQYLSLFGGDTSYQTLSRVDCLLFQLPSNLPAYTLRIFWLNLQPVALLIASQIVGFIFLRLKNIQQNRQSFYTSVIFLFVFFQPSIIKVLSQSFSCIQVGNKTYVISDLTQECYGENHIQNIVQIILPILLFWLIIVPCFLLYRMHKYRLQFKRILVVYRYGFLYQEYRPEVYYWDIVRLYLRSLIIILVNVIRFSTILQGLLIVGLLTMYLSLQKKNNPYQSITLNKSDRQQCIVILQSLYALFLAQYFDNDIINYLTLSFLVAVNLVFVLKMAKSIFIRYIPFEPERRSFFEKILVKIKVTFPILFKWVIVKKISSNDCQQNWKKLKKLIEVIKVNQSAVKEFSKQSYIKSIKNIGDSTKRRRSYVIKNFNPIRFTSQIQRQIRDLFRH